MNYLRRQRLLLHVLQRHPQRREIRFVEQQRAHKRCVGQQPKPRVVQKRASKWLVKTRRFLNVQKMKRAQNHSNVKISSTPNI